MIYIYHQETNNMWYAAAIQKDRVFATAFSPREQEVLRHLLGNLPYNVPFQLTEKPNKLLTELLKTLRAIFDGKDSASYGFKIALGHLSSYTRRVLNHTSLIPVGYLTTYGAIAKVAGGSPRSVGRTEASNPFPLLIPCHRVVRAGFSIGGYGLGEKVKLGLLLREDRGYEETRRLKVEDKELSLFPIKYLRKRLD
ncbi:MAG: MGMT family protein [Candidatus Bathyarchaeota archaeon]|nr:MGMT family protein [Candidatus Bathyarchaeota archaeon]